MEVLKKESKSGRIYRIYKEVAAWDLYVIEFLKTGKCADGSEFRAWFPAYEPKNKVFDSFENAKIAFDAFLQT